jgi:hypothetical protein
MLTRFDDYPIHQVPLPVAHTATSDRNFYDRYFFNGYVPDGEVFFGAALGLYPNRRVIDAAFSVVHNGRQKNLYASGRAPFERGHTAVGPITVEVVKPMEHLRVIVGANEHGIEADLLFTARTVAVEEARQTMRIDNVPFVDMTRMTQAGTWSGWLSVDGVRIELDPLAALGTRDRSWGIRPIGEPAGGAPAPKPPQLFWLWGPANFADESVFVACFDNPKGTLDYQHSVTAPVRTSTDYPVLDPGGIATLYRAVDIQIEWEPGTRRARQAHLALTPHGSAAPRSVTYEVLFPFQMAGLGYSHPTRRHGAWHGELSVHSDEWLLSDVDPTAAHNIHVQNFCRVTLDDKVGWGILEQLAIGPHVSGLTGILDPYRG